MQQPSSSEAVSFQDSTKTRRNLVTARELRNEILREELAEVKKAAIRRRFRWKGHGIEAARSGSSDWTNGH